jgi:acyl-CoA synthetase (AMP-forming)/AMP-acid ligase II
VEHAPSSGTILRGPRSGRSIHRRRTYDLDDVSRSFDHLARAGEHTHALQRVMIGGSALPLAMARTFAEKYGVKVLQTWGMTELSPMGVVATPAPALLSHGETYAQDVIWSRQGRLRFGVEVKVIAEDGTEVPSDGITSGALLARGPWTVQRYFKAEGDAVDSKGWFDTGDVVTLDKEGYIRITDEVMAHLAKQVAKWWLPDAMYIDTIPQTAAGKG